ncbi:MAG: hypothetical protein K9G76_04810 [Bacteroidales bacterium]|nr:hypothetical protein [Bacteroidales bacterium]MCF8402999.1 hypothetical protein [Bacteroidales bacterium]
MKKRTLIMLAFTVIASASIILLNACSKSDQSKPEGKADYKYADFVPVDDQVPQLIEGFNQKYSDFKTGYKSGESIPLNEVIWTLEAGVNYEFTEPRDENALLIEVPSQITIPVEFSVDNTPVVSMEDVFEAYSSFISSTEGFLTTGENETKFVLADVELGSLNGNNANINLTLLGGLYYPGSCQIDDNNDYWYFFDGLGRCNDLSPAYTGLDAMHRLDNLMNCAQPYCSTGTPVYYGIVTYEIPGALGGEVDDCENPEWLDYDFDYNVYYMNLYKPSGKSYLNCNSYQDLITSYPEEIYGQVMVIRYGNWYCQGGGE